LQDSTEERGGRKRCKEARSETFEAPETCQSGSDNPAQSINTFLSLFMTLESSGSCQTRRIHRPQQTTQPIGTHGRRQTQEIIIQAPYLGRHHHHRAACSFHITRLDKQTGPYAHGHFQPLAQLQRTRRGTSAPTST
jgi:hypothetical protein